MHDGVSDPARLRSVPLSGGPADGRSVVVDLHQGQVQTSLYLIVLGDEIVTIGDSTTDEDLNRAGHAQREGRAVWCRYDLIAGRMEFIGEVHPAWESQ